VLITDVQVAGQRALVDVRCTQGLVSEIGSSLQRVKGEQLLGGFGAALLPGLHDHHIHLLALAALGNSVQCGPPHVANAEQLAQVLLAHARTGGPPAHPSGWLRGVGYHESVAGPLDRWQLDEFVSDRPLKIQHRSGKLWIVNSAAAELLALDDHAHLAGVELDSLGRPNGRLFRLDGWMRTQLAQVAQAASGAQPALAAVSRRLASYGVTGVTDTTPDNGAVALQYFVRAAAAGDLLQDVRVMGDDTLPQSACGQIQRGERKVMLDEDTLPDWDALMAIFANAHRQGRAVAVHCVTPAELVLALSVLRTVGVRRGDRIEHASLVPSDVMPLLREVGVRVVTQPGFIRERGDQYLQSIAATEHGDLYRCHSLLLEGIPVAGSTDAPYGDCDPWAAMRAAVQRSTRSGMLLGGAERLSPEQALALFTSAADDPGGNSREIVVGATADLCLLDRGWQGARLRLCSDDVMATIRRGELIHHRERQDIASLATCEQ
jgi:predicted amidohydrolase YtcJ